MPTLQEWPRSRATESRVSQLLVTREASKLGPMRDQTRTIIFNEAKVSQKFLETIEVIIIIIMTLF